MTTTNSPPQHDDSAARSGQMRLTGLPRLDGATLVDVQLDGTTLVLWVEAIRQAGIVAIGEIRLAGVRSATSREPRHADDACPLKAPTTIVRAQWQPHRLRLECLKETGPGDADTPIYEIEFDTVVHHLRPAVGKTLRRWVGWYPGPHDFDKRLPGPSTVSIDALRQPR